VVCAQTRESAENEQKRLVSDLRRALKDKDLTIDKQTTALVHWSKKWEDLLEKVRQQTEQHRIKEQSSQDTNKQLEEQLNEKTEYARDTRMCASALSLIFIALHPLCVALLLCCAQANREFVAVHRDSEA
jgi:hypothetical protein